MEKRPNADSDELWRQMGDQVPSSGRPQTDYVIDYCALLAPDRHFEAVRNGLELLARMVQTDHVFPGSIEERVAQVEEMGGGKR